MEFGNPPVIEFTRALGCVGEAARENAVTVAGAGGGSRSKPNQTKPKAKLDSVEAVSAR